MFADPDLDEALLRGGIQPGDKVRDCLKAIRIDTSGSPVASPCSSKTMPQSETS